MKHTLRFALIALLTFVAAPAFADVKLGEPVNFTATDMTGKKIDLQDYKGKIVVMEWKNIGCPFVKKFYGVGAMQKFQKDLTAKGVVWLSVTSSAQGKEGFLTAEKAQAKAKEEGSNASAWILDASGDLGRQFGARTTPHMYIIDKEGKLAYAGAIDDKPSTSADDIKGANNYVLKAVAELLADKPVTTITTTPYGCSVKY
jgi:peroxiredoxin